MYRNEAIVKDGTVTEVLGRPTKVGFSRTDDGRTLMVLDVRDVAGGEHQVTTQERAHMHRLVRMAGFTEPGFLPRVIDSSKGTHQRKKVMDALATRDPILFRLNPDNSVYAMMTDQWRRNEIEAVRPIIEEVFAGVDASIDWTPSNGYHGGSASITMPALNDLVTPRVRVEMGPKDGCHSFKVVSAAVILFCSNQLTLEVGQALGGIVDTRFVHYLAQQHRASVMNEDFLIDALTESRDSIGGVLDLVEASKKAAIKETQAARLMRYYEATRAVSGQASSTIRTLFGIGEIAQVPGTLYGLAMAASWYGTHHLDVPDTVRRSVNTMAGEMLVVSPHAKEYYDVVDGYCKVLDEREAAKAAAGA